MILLVHDLTDLLGSLTDTKFWFVKRQHQGRWYYLYSFDQAKNAATWTRSQEKAINYSYEKAANAIASKLLAQSHSVEVTYERLRK